MFDLVRNAHDRYDIQTIALAEMLRLHELLDVNVTIGVPSGTEVVYLRVIEARQSLGAVQRPGMREPIHCSASGKALLAYTQDAAVHLLLKGYDFKRYTDRTVTTAEGFEMSSRLFVSMALAKITAKSMSISSGYQRQSSTI